MKYFNKAILSLVITSVISGCSTYEDIENDANVIKANAVQNVDIVDRLRAKERRWKNVTITDTIFAPPVHSEEVKRPAWWYDKISLSSGEVSFSKAVNTILSGTGVNISFREGVDQNAVFNFSGKTIGEAIDSLAGASGYSFRIPAKNKIIFSLYETRVFSIAALPGTESFAQGQNQKVSEKSTVSATDEFIKAEGEVDVLDEVYQELLSYSSFKDVEKAASSAITDLTIPMEMPQPSYGSNSDNSKNGDSKSSQSEKSPKKKEKLKVSDIPIYVSRATSTITVKDTPEVLDEMQRIVDMKNRKLLTQVELEIDLIELKLSEEAAKNFDLSIALSNVGQYGYNLASGSAVNAANTTIGSASLNLPTSILSAGVGEGKFSGTQAVIEALRSAGTVSNRTMPKQLIRNNTIAKMRAFDNIGYISERSISTTANVGTESSIEQGNLELGYSLYAMPTVFENNVSVRLATNLSNLISLTKKGDTDASSDSSESSTKSYVESPHTTHKDFMANFAAYNGDTIILSGLSRDLKQIDEAKGITSTAQSQSSSRTETLMLVTSRIIHPRI